MAVEIFQQPRKKANIYFQANALTDFDEVFFANAPIFRIVVYQISQFATLVIKMDVRKPSDPIVEARAIRSTRSPNH